MKKELKNKVFVYDTTLRDGGQGEGVSFSLMSKLKMTRRLDEFGVEYIELTSPAASPQSEKDCKRIANLDTVLVRLEGAEYPCHGIKYGPVPSLLHVDAKASLDRFAELTARHAGLRVVPVAADVTDEKSVNALVDRTMQNFSRVDIRMNGDGKPYLLTDTAGVLDARGRLIPTLDGKTARGLVRRKVIKGGMIPKVECCMRALEGGVTKAHIIDGRIPFSLMLELFTDSGIGTQIIKE